MSSESNRCRHHDTQKTWLSSQTAKKTKWWNNIEIMFERFIYKKNGLPSQASRSAFPEKNSHRSALWMWAAENRTRMWETFLPISLRSSRMEVKRMKKLQTELYKIYNQSRRNRNRTETALTKLPKQPQNSKKITNKGDSHPTTAFFGRHWLILFRTKCATA